MRGTVSCVSLLLLTLLTGACASTGAVPHPFPAPGGWAAMPSPDTSRALPGAYAPPRPAAAPPLDGYSLTGTALSLRGTPYRNGGIDPKTGFDCSGFTQYVFSQHGLSLPREVRD
ncbi:MAG: C40 family peptidase, partial [Acidobacteria bacterium]|nr:C40 family peptidase [Acidobacteriota bacterium]